MTDPELFLASRSPRRRELLEQIGVRYQVLDVQVEEVRADGESAADYARRIAADKARAGWALRPAGARAPVLGADTDVVLDGAILGKPADPADARRMLASLSGREHAVYSAVALCDAGRVQVRLNVTRVWFRAIEAGEIAAYVATGEPMDKAGAYAIQGRAAAFIARIDGSYSGVMGLPLFETADLLRPRR
ncbi:MAG: nucleoside triphosphate pyrophosphatase [Gammaproteobacteria bacterium]